MELNFESNNNAAVIGVTGRLDTRIMASSSRERSLSIGFGALLMELANWIRSSGLFLAVSIPGAPLSVSVAIPKSGSSVLYPTDCNGSQCQNTLTIF